MLTTINRFAILALALTTLASSVQAKDWVVYEGKQGPGLGKHIVFVTGDEEYRSEEGMPMMAKILALRHGFKCTVLFAIDRKTGAINPDEQTNIPGMDHLGTADLVVLFTRFRELPDAEMKYFVDYFHSGKPIIALRTATHAFRYERNPKSPYAKYSFDSKEWPGGFGQQVLGETWINHHGRHKKEATRGLIDGRNKDHPILRGVQDIFGTSDVYGVKNLPADARILLHGMTLTGLNPGDPPKLEKSLMPIAWVRYYKNESGKTNRIFTTTMGASVDLLNEDLRRLVVNAIYWGLEFEVPEKVNVEYAGPYEPIFYGFGEFAVGVMPSAHEW
jgi:hypothetical protein